MGPEEVTTSSAIAAIYMDIENHKYLYTDGKKHKFFIGKCSVIECVTK